MLPTAHHMLLPALTPSVGAYFNLLRRAVHASTIPLSNHSQSTTSLSYEVVSTGPQSSEDDPNQTTALFLHGLLGSGRNWRSFTRKLVGEAAKQHSHQLRVVLVDLRNHGQSTLNKALHPPHSLEAAARDVQELIHTALGGVTPSIVVGHSLGGKVALELLKQLSTTDTHRPLALPQQVWVLDSQPGRVDHIPNSGDSVAHIIETIKSIPLPIPSRQWLYSHLEGKGIQQGTILWLGSNLVGKGQQLEWGFNIQGAAAMYHSYRMQSYWGQLQEPPPGTAVHLVRAEQSDRWTPAMVQQLEECKKTNLEACRLRGRNVGLGPFHLHLLPAAGHWLHSDNPTGLLNLMLPPLLSADGS